jgi:hypothetical protein
MRRILSAVWIGLLVSAAFAQVASTSLQQPPPVHLTSEQDHQRTMDALHITSLRRSVDNDPKSQYPVNYSTKARSAVWGLLSKNHSA